MDMDSLFEQLLEMGRASEAEYDAATDRLARGEVTEADMCQLWTPLAIPLDATVCLTGLSSRADLNGKRGRVISFVKDKHRYGVSVLGEALALKPGNLEHRPGEEPDPEPTQETCTRCQEPCVPGSTCRVPHPTSLRQDCGSEFGAGVGGGMRNHWSCEACGKRYTTVTDIHDPSKVSFHGPRWCFKGAHSTRRLPSSDRRCIDKASITLVAGPQLQQQIDALPAEVRVLSIVSASFYDEKLVARLDRSMPNLETLQVVDVHLTELELSPATTPKLSSLKLQNLPNDCDLYLELPELLDFSIHYWGGDGDVINHMLSRATKLRVFESYKLWVDSLSFASNDLEVVDLHRSDSLDALTLWAPNLRSLNLQACYGLDDINFLDTHPLKAALPRTHTPPPLEVNTLNSNLGTRAKRALKRNPRVVKASGMEQSSNPCESFFQQFSQMPGAGGF